MRVSRKTSSHDRRLFWVICCWKVWRVAVMTGPLARPGQGAGGAAGGTGGTLGGAGGTVGGADAAPAPPPKPRSTVGTCVASGSASKKSRFLKPSGPAMRLLGMVTIVVL